MGVLAGSNVVTHVVAEVVSGHQDGAGGGGAGHGQEGEADESLRWIIDFKYWIVCGNFTGYKLIDGDKFVV